MKTCPKCGEINGDNNSRCFKCNAVLGPVASYKKICPNCRTIYSGTKDVCEKCQQPLAVYNESNAAVSSSQGGSSTWMYVIAVLIPLIGTILGLIYLGRREDSLGKSVLVTSIVAWVAWAFIACLIIFA